MFVKNLPHKTVERLSQYRRTLLLILSKEKTHVFSHEIALMLHITPVQVRRDLMLIGYSGNLRKGYDIKELIELIGRIIDAERGQRVAVVGLGNLGKAFISYFKSLRNIIRTTILSTFICSIRNSGARSIGIRNSDTCSKDKVAGRNKGTCNRTPGPGKHRQVADMGR